MPATLIADRYPLVSELGQGSMGQVFKVVDPQDGGERALKLLLRAPAGAEEAARQAMRQEFQVMAGLRHPRMLQVFDFGELPDGAAYFTMEVVEGSDLLSLAPLDPDRARALLAQLLDALSYLHRQGFVHGDLKPENLRLDATGDLKLMDFGLLKSTGTEGSPIQGTPAYLAPEVIRQERVDGRADLYAAGCVFYHLLAGRPPFIGDEVLNVLNAHLRQPARPLDEIRQDLPDDLVNAIARLMRKAPEDRFLSADDALEALGISRGEVRGRLLSVPLVGREAELSALSAVLSDARQSVSPRLAVLTGEPGIGKTRLLDAYRAQSQLEGVRFVRIQVAPGGPPYAPWIELIQALLPVACQFDASVATRAAAVLGSFYPGLETAPLEDPRLFRLHLVETVALVLRASAGDGVAIAIDDWDTADANTRGILDDVRSRLDDVPTVFLVAVANAKSAPGGVRLPLGDLVPAEAKRLVEGLLGYPTADPEFASRLVAHLGGHPGTLEEGLALLIEQGALRLSAGQWEAEDTLDAMPSNSRDLLEAKLALLSEAGRKVAAALAIARRPLDLGLLNRALGEDQAIAGAFELVAAGLASAGAHGYALRSLALGHIVHERTAEPTRRTLAGALADALFETFDAQASSFEEQATLARLSLDAGWGRRAATACIQAARTALSLYAIEEGRHWATSGEAALELEPDADLAEWLNFLVAEADRHAGRMAEAVARYETIAGAQPEIGVRAGVAHGICLNVLSRAAEAQEVLREARAQALAHGMAHEAVRAANYLGRIRAQAGDATGALEVLEPALLEARAANLPGAEATCLGLLGIVFTTLATDRLSEGVSALEASLRIHRERNDTYGLNDAYELLGNAQMAMGSFASAERSFTENLRCSRELGVSPDNQLTAELNLALVSVERGEFEQAAKGLGRLAVDFVQHGNRFMSAAARAAEALAHAACGNMADSQDALDDAVAMSQMLESDYLLVLAGAYGAEAALLTGRNLRAIEQVDAALERIRQGQAAEWKARLLVTRAEALLAMDELERSAEAMAIAREAAEKAHAKALTARLQRLSGAWEMKREQHAEAIKALEQAYRQAEECGQFWLMAEAALLRAYVGRARGEAPVDWLTCAVEFAEVGGYLGVGAEASYALGTEETIASRRERWFARAHELIARALDRLDPASARAFLSVGERQLVHRHLMRTGQREADTGRAGGVATLSEALSMSLGEVLSALGAPRPTSFPDARILGELEDLVAGVGDAKALCTRIARWLVQRTSAERALVILYDSDGGELARQAVSPGLEGQGSLGGFAARFVAMVQRDRRMVRTTDSVGDPNASNETRSVVAIPLLHLQELLGILYVDAPEPSGLGEDDLGLIQMLASYASVGVFNARLLARTEDALRSASALSEVARAVASTMELDELASTLLAQSLAVTGAERGYVLMGGALEPLAALDHEGRAIDTPRFSQSIARRALGTCQAIVMTDAPENLSASQSMLALEIQSVMCVPLVVKDISLGVIYVSSHATRLAFGPEHLSILESIAAQAALSVNNALLFQDLRDTLQRERQAQIEKSKMARYLSSAARQAAKGEDDEVEPGGRVTNATVMFADIRGFTTLSERMSPQQVVAILNTYLTRMERIITQHGGVLDKFMGDGIMAVFVEDPEEPGRDALQAALAACAMQESVQEMNAQLLFGADESLRIGIGLNSGEVVAGNIGSPERMDYTVIGDNVNLAARLESNAKPGKILISAATASRIGDRLRLEPMGTLTVKGKTQAVEVYHVIG